MLYQVRTQIRRGNQVRILNDPVTVFGESVFIIPLHNPYRHVRRGEQAFDPRVRKPAWYMR